jgi:hypothetical protein
VVNRNNFGFGLLDLHGNSRKPLYGDNDPNRLHIWEIDLNGHWVSV